MCNCKPKKQTKTERIQELEQEVAQLRQTVASLRSHSSAQAYRGTYISATARYGIPGMKTAGA